MTKGLLSIIIPDRNGQPYLQKTIDGLLENAEGDIEIIVVCDGVWPNPPLKDDKRVIIIHHGAIHSNYGMKTGINRGIAVSSGEFIMKTDAHCMFGKGFDKKLIANLEKNWVVIPRRYRLEPDKWEIVEDGRPPIDYMFLSYPYERPFDKTCGIHGDDWRERTRGRMDIMIDDTMSMQGSCYFMHRSHWDNIEGLDPETFGEFTMEAQEISLKTQLSGGRLIINKNTWYAHMHKGKRGKGYGFSNAQYKAHSEGNEKGRLAGIDYWVYNKWPKRIHDFDWLIEKFWPVPTWPENWKEQIEIDKLKDYSTLNYKGDYWLKGLQK